MRITTEMRRYLNRYERATRAHEFKGAARPEDWAEIDKEYEIARQKLEKYILNLHERLKEAMQTW